jgi:hypothetical protein
MVSSIGEVWMGCLEYGSLIDKLSYLAKFSRHRFLTNHDSLIGNLLHFQNKKATPQFAGVTFLSIIILTLRFMALWVSVSFGTRGEYSPYPTKLILSGLILSTFIR